jgi:hypothetical protein
MLTLTYGFFKPESGDKGSVFWQKLESNFQQLNDHTHNGTDSSKIGPSAITGLIQDLVSADWVTGVGGLYSQLVTMPGTLQFNEVLIEFVINSGTDIGCIFLPTILKVSANTFYVYINDNSVDVRIIYK